MHIEIQVRLHTHIGRVPHASWTMSPSSYITCRAMAKVELQPTELYLAHLKLPKLQGTWCGIDGFFILTSQIMHSQARRNHRRLRF